MIRQPWQLALARPTEAFGGRGAPRPAAGPRNAGLEAGKITPAASAALVAAGLLSAALFPAGAERVLPRRPRRPGEVAGPAPSPPACDQEPDEEPDQEPEATAPPAPDSG
jgi:hypothetical protein